MYVNNTFLYTTTCPSICSYDILWSIINNLIIVVDLRYSYALIYLCRIIRNNYNFMEIILSCRYIYSNILVVWTSWSGCYDLRPVVIDQAIVIWPRLNRNSPIIAICELPQSFFIISKLQITYNLILNFYYIDK